MNERELLAWIADWMIRNDYECGDEGSLIYDEICKVIGGNED